MKPNIIKKETQMGIKMGTILSPFTGFTIIGMVSIWAITQLKAGDDYFRYFLFLFGLTVGCIIAGWAGDHFHNSSRNKFEFELEKEKLKLEKNNATEEKGKGGVELETEERLLEERGNPLDEFKLAIQTRSLATDSRIRLSNYLYLLQGGGIVALNFVGSDNLSDWLNWLLCFIVAGISFIWIFILERNRLGMKFWGIKMQDLGKLLGFTSFLDEAKLLHRGEEVEFANLEEEAPLKAGWLQRRPITILESILPGIFCGIWTFLGVAFYLKIIK